MAAPPRLGVRTAALALVWTASACLPDALDDAALDAKIAAASYRIDCAAQVDCALKEGCHGDEGCVAACSAGVDSAAAANASALRTCHEGCSVDCKAVSGADKAACARTCLTVRCGAELLTCAAPVAAGTGRCIDVQNCFSACPAPSSGETAGCAKSCLTALASVDLALASDFATCQSGALAAGKEPSKVCGAELGACYAGGVTGTAGCHEAFQCQEVCKAGGKDDNTCLSECFATLSAAAQTGYLDFLLCASKHGTDLTDCKTPLISCAQPSGTASCKAMVDQTVLCTKQKGTAATGSCAIETLHGGSANSAGPYLDLLDCLGKQCAGPCGSSNVACNGCIAAKCLKQANACGNK